MSQPSSANAVEGLVARLKSHNPIERRDARGQLVLVGSAAVPALITALRDQDAHVRWEAAKALSDIDGATEAIPALVPALEDKEPGVRWLAAQALVAAGEPAVVPVLRALINQASSAWFREGAHHVLKSLVTPQTSEVVQALEGHFQAISVPVAANKALESLESK